jgi:hypothetical protein
LNGRAGTATTINELGGVIFPQVESVVNGIQSLSINRAPFQQLNIFRTTCFNAFSINQRKSLTLTQTLHLYLAAYQTKSIWKACWKSIIPIMSSQISRDVETFVAATPFATDEFVDLLQTGNAWSRS